MKRKWLQTTLAGVLCASLLVGCGTFDVNQVFPQGLDQFVLDAVEEGLRRADGFQFPEELQVAFPKAAQAAETLLSNAHYYENLSPTDLAFRLGKKEATLDEYREFVREQVLQMRTVSAWLLFLTMEDHCVRIIVTLQHHVH